jgi:hypothetical protein
MPALRISIDGNEVATVCTDGYDVVNARVSGTRIDDEPATLGVSGTSQPENGESVYRTWVNELPLKPGQVVAVSLLESASTSHAGKTIEELFPEEDITEEADFTVTTEMFAELRAKPKLREKYSFLLKSSSGASFAGESKPDEHGFSFSVVWNSFHPERARISLHSYTLDSLENRDTPLVHLFEERTSPESMVTFELVA